MTKHILVTGSSGTVGTALVQALDAKGFAVTPLDIRPSIWDAKINRRTFRCDLRKPLSKLKLKHTPDVIVHLAANARVHDSVLDPKLALDNYLMVYNLLEYARQHSVSRFIYASSREVYGETGTKVKFSESDTHVTKLKSPYSASKFGAEALVHSYHDCYDIKPVITRLSNVYGRYDVSERVIPLFMYYAQRGRELCVFGREKKLDFTYIDDCIDGLIRIIKRFDKVAGRTFNLASGRGERLLDLATMIRDQLASDSNISISSKRVGEISSFIGDISKARKLLGYNPKVSLKQGLAATAEWYVQAMKHRRIYETQRRNLARRGWA
ncbi:MAG: NAD-dependent epimerase/dehydratase family protein [candidate division Zixibacteria bacterium]|nr:NAD-dependent epimerase/dehydratase family protein [candidate division Zixibacteria bacterium]MDH3938549.1 NAD-dependent epimerase/dehydratase family protein [candidate division Zixibacteria bacterium]MDH4034815.1 NAD-dependent epimerase/dehydratase family protein [candidate division Zixibacteria bacterium]